MNPLENVAYIFGEMIKIHEALGNQYKVNAFKRALRHVKLSGSVAELKNKPGIGKKLKLKIDEIVNTGKLKELEDFKRDPTVVAIQKLIKIKGFGPRYINYIVKHFKARNIKDVRELVKSGKIKVNEQQRVGIKYYEDLNHKIPRSEAEFIVSCLHKIAKANISKGIKLTLVGSYRRGRKESGDVDIVMTDKDDDPDALVTLREFLLDNNVLLDCFVVGNTRFSCLIKTSKSPYARQVDILYVPVEDYHTAVFHFSSGELFNRKIRLYAKSKGMKLSERGLFKGNKKLPIKSERDIFKYLKLQFVPVKYRE